MRFFLAIFAMLSTCLTTQAAPRNSGFETLSRLSNGVTYTGRVQNGAPLGACQTRISKSSDRSILVELSYSAGLKKLVINVPKGSSVDAEGALLIYENRDGGGVQVGHLNGKYFQITVAQNNGGPIVTCGSFINFLGN